MKVSELLESRRRNWQELEALCDQVQRSTTARTFNPFRWFARRPTTAARLQQGGLTPQSFVRFSNLYRSACADLALADSYQLPPNTVQYLHRLVGRAHNQLYRSRMFQWERWGDILLHRVPQTVFHDRCVQFAFVLFWGIFFMAAALGYSEDYWPEFAQELLGREQLEQMENMFKDELQANPGQRFGMAGFYIQHNTGIGLQCFAFGVLVVPGILVTAFNAAVLGASFGYMAREDVTGGKNFFEFVTAHGPFELTAIVLAAGAGLRLGVSWIFTGGLTRSDSLRRTAKEAMPIMGSAMVMFFLAAMIEGFISPSVLPYWIKASIAVVSSALLMFYFVLLGMPRRSLDAT
jgi:uncharacterized membrane protein SpoIIM required for sporulation